MVEATGAQNTPPSVVVVVVMAIKSRVIMGGGYKGNQHNTGTGFG